MADTQQAPTVWENQIVGYANIPPDQLLANPRNFRIHPAFQQEAAQESLELVGWVQDVIVNIETGFVLDGHLRVQLALRTDQPTVPVKYVQLTEEQEGRALAMLDATSALAVPDPLKLQELMGDIQASMPQGAALTMLQELVASAGTIPDGLADLVEGKYTAKADTPIYEPQGEMPSLPELYDTTRYNQLMHEILEADLPEGIRGFLELAATRHIVFRYSAIAEYYCHAPADIQQLMEASALVIIDLEQAIERGYASLREGMLDAIREARADG